MSQGLLEEERTAVKKFDPDKVADIVTEVLGRDFEKIRILKVNVTPDHDPDGNDILGIQIVFEGTLKGADVRHAAGAVRRLRPALEEIDVNLFPLVSFVSKLDYERGHGRETL
jgi:hypothetical protein